MRISDWSSDVCSSDLENTAEDAPSARPSANTNHSSFRLLTPSLNHSRHRKSMGPDPTDGYYLTGANTRAMGMGGVRSEEHTSELQSLMRISYAVFCLKQKKSREKTQNTTEKDELRISCTMRQD